MADKKQKLSMGRWVFLGVLVLFTMWYFKRGGTFAGGSALAMRGPDTALRAYAAAAENIATNRPGQTVDGLLELVTDEDREWFRRSFFTINKENAAQGRTAQGTDPRLNALRILVNRGLNTQKYTVDKREDLSRTYNYSLKIPSAAGEKGLYIAVKKGKDGNWRTEAFNGGRIGR